MTLRGSKETRGEDVIDGVTRLRPDEWRVGGTPPPLLQTMAAQAAAKAGDEAAAKTMFEDAKAAEAARQAGAGGAPAEAPAGTRWLVELVALNHTAENKHKERMLTDLIRGPFKGVTLKTTKIGPDGKRSVLELGG